jgi:hypothetical protein
MLHLKPVPEIPFVTIHLHKGQLKLSLCATNSLGEFAAYWKYIFISSLIIALKNIFKNVLWLSGPAF